MHLCTPRISIPEWRQPIQGPLPREMHYNSLNSRNIGQVNDLTKNYILGVLSLREAAMGMNRVLTGSARASESQIKALQATLPGYEANSSFALQKMHSFAQNVEQLRKPIPVIPRCTAN